MSNLKVSFLLACLLPFQAFAQGVQTLDEYVAMQRAALSPPKSVSPASGSVVDASGARIGLVGTAAVKVPGVDGPISSGAAQSTVMRAKADANVDFVPPKLPRIYGILISPNVAPLVLASSEFGGAEFMVPTGESIPNSAWRIVSISAVNKVVGVQLSGGSSSCVSSSKKKCASPAIVEVKL